MDDHTPLIRADGGDWAETEVLGQRAVVKVRASAGTLRAIAQTPGFLRVPIARLDDTLASLTAGQRAALLNAVLDMGYTTQEFQARFPDGLGGVTLGEVLRFVASRRRQVRYDQAGDVIVDDGPVEVPTPVDTVDGLVT